MRFSPFAEQSCYRGPQMVIGEGLAQEWPCTMGSGQVDAGVRGHERKRNSSALQNIRNRLDGPIYEIDVEQRGVERFVESHRETREYRADGSHRFASHLFYEVGNMQSEDDLIFDDQYARLANR